MYTLLKLLQIREELIKRGAGLADYLSKSAVFRGFRF